jgi:hypothetical protein
LEERSAGVSLTSVWDEDLFCREGVEGSVGVYVKWSLCFRGVDEANARDICVNYGGELEEADKKYDISSFCAIFQETRSAG